MVCYSYCFNAYMICKYLIYLDDNLLIGTRQGFLFMYNVEPGTEEKYNVQLMRLNKSFSKKAISQLEVIPDYQLLICLTGDYYI